jgi:hypothetical protein
MTSFISCFNNPSARQLGFCIASLGGAEHIAEAVGLGANWVSMPFFLEAE